MIDQTEELLKKLERIALALESLAVTQEYAVRNGLLVLPDEPASDN